MYRESLSHYIYTIHHYIYTIYIHALSLYIYTRALSLSSLSHRQKVIDTIYHERLKAVFADIEKERKRGEESV